MALSYGQFRVAKHHIKLPTDAIVDLLDESCGPKALAGEILRPIASPVGTSASAASRLMGDFAYPPIPALSRHPRGGIPANCIHMAKLVPCARIWDRGCSFGRCSAFGGC